MYEELKKKYNEAFKREVTDREIAEALYEQNQQYAQELSDMEGELCETRDLLKAEQAKQARAVSESMYDLVEKIENLQAIPCEDKTITITIHGETVRFDCDIRGLYED